MAKDVDIITELQELAFASRLKRLSERLMKDVSQLYRKLDVDFEARWFSILYALNRQSPMTVTALAQTLRFTHTAANQLSTEMTKKGLLYTAKGEKDERQRFLHLSEKGRRTVESGTRALHTQPRAPWDPARDLAGSRAGHELKLVTHLTDQMAHLYA